jgi:hypothetical protein
MDWFDFRTAAVRDLAWACFSRPLLHIPSLRGADADLDNCHLRLDDGRRDLLQALDRRPAPLLDFLHTARDRRLGLYFEQLWHFWLRYDPTLELIAHNLPVRAGQRTVGEFDCLYLCRQSGRCFHLELAVKFYLGLRGGGRNGSCSDAAAWLGPGCNDRLDWKIDRLLHHQAQLSRHPAAVTLLGDLGIRGPAREVEVKGYLFTCANDPLPPPAGLYPARELQPWLTLNELPAWLASRPTAARFLPLDKPRWLHPALLSPDDTALGSDALQAELRQHFSRRRQPRLVAELDPAGRECHRFFATGSDWPFPVRASGGRRRNPAQDR